jgi:hypothetical protein
MSFTIPDWLRDEIQVRWEQLAIRKWINKNPMIIVSITTASVLTLLVIIGLSMPKKTIKTVREYNEQGWFYDLNTGKLFVAESDTVPPIDAPSGAMPDGKPAGVRAYVFSYADEPNETNRFIGFLEIPNPTPTVETKDTQSIISETSGAIRWGRGKLIRRVEDKQWVPADSNEGQSILRKLFIPNEKGEVAHYCPPD